MMEGTVFAFLGALVGGVIAVLGNLIVINRQSEKRVKEHRYSRLYERQLEVLATIYRLLTDFEFTYKSIADRAIADKVVADDEECLDEARKRFVDAKQYFEQHRLYVDPELGNRIDHNLAQCGLAITSESLVRLGVRRNAQKNVNGELTELRHTLASRFRHVLDIRDEKASQLWSRWRHSL